MHFRFPLPLIALFFGYSTSAQQWNYYGNTVQLSCQCLELTQAQNTQAGSFWNLNTINLNQPFDFTFSIYLGNDDAGADGIVFVLQNTNNTIPPSTGGGLGYEGFPNQSFAVEFDTYDNGSSYSDIPEDHIAIDLNGSLTAVSGPVQMSASSTNTEDGAWHTVRFVWDPSTNTFSVYFDGTLRIAYNVPGGLINGIFGGNPTVYFGWTGSTGGAINVQQVCSIFDAAYGAGVNYTQCNPAVPLQFDNTSSSSLNNIVGYSWDFGDGSPLSTLEDPLHTFPAAGTYTVSLTITDQTLCTDVQTQQITIYPLPAANATVTNVSCQGAANGSLNLNVFNGIGPSYTTWWNPPLNANPNGPSNFVVNGLGPGTYTAYIIDNPSGCSSIIPYTINEPTALSLSASATSIPCPGLNNGSITLTISGGTPPYSYNGQPVPAGVTTLNNLAPGTYAGTLTDAQGCTASASVTLTSPGPQSVTLNAINNVCNGATSGSVSAQMINGTGTINYSWNNGLFSGPNLNNLTAGVYTVTATDQNGCSVSNTATLTDPPPVALAVTTTDLSCYGVPTGTATANPAGGLPPFSYNWNPGGGGGAALTNLNAGSYSVTAADQNGCNFTTSFTINQPAEIIVGETHTDVACFGEATGSIQLNVSGGTAAGGYTYNWNPAAGNGSSASSLAAGIYNISVTDDNLCTVSVSVTIDEPVALLTLNTSGVDVLCFGGATGSVQVTVSGGTAGYQYLWSPAQPNTATINGLTTGVYDVTVTDSQGCTAIGSQTITEPAAALSVNPLTTSVSCYQSADGSIQLQTSGGTAGYQFNWSPVAANADQINGLSAGNWQVTVTDANGCSLTGSYLLTEPIPLTISEVVTPVLCAGDTTGSIVLTASGGTPDVNGNYQYLWSAGGGTTNSLSGLSAGNYSVTLTDNNGCSLTDNWTITSPPPLTMNPQITDASCFGTANGQVELNGGGGVLPYQYQLGMLTNGNGQFSGLAAGSYSATITDAQFCTYGSTINISQPTELNVTITTIQPLCPGQLSGSAEANVNGGSAPYTFTFSTGQTGAVNVLSGIGAGTYDVTITDNQGCVTVAQSTLTDPDSLTLSVNPVEAAVMLGESLTLELQSNYTGTVYSWSPETGLSCSACAQPVVTTYYDITYTVVAENENGCSASLTIPVSVTPRYDVYIPNVFSPNGDGANDFLTYYGNQAAIKQVQFSVFNRWGEKVFESSGIHFQWDGQYRGNPLPVGVYTYQARFVFVNNYSTPLYSGSVTLLR
jgi:gliding motility-associated-like protein